MDTINVKQWKSPEAAGDGRLQSFYYYYYFSGAKIIKICSNLFVVKRKVAFSSLLGPFFGM
jgi:hypothetical protein